MSVNSINKQNKKLYCPFGRKRCSTDSTVCGYLGYYLECPKQINESKRRQAKPRAAYFMTNSVRENE